MMIKEPPVGNDPTLYGKGTWIDFVSCIALRPSPSNIAGQMFLLVFTKKRPASVSYH
uniref:Uncharacterized protein n=1 Tax=Arundo donax TaxID=35708 RepID=A0A0A9E4F3_ARUDO